MSCCKEVGGYFGLECGKSADFHDGVYLNSGRNALRYIIRAYGIKSMHVPAYTCPVVWEAVKAENCDISLYDIDENFMPVHGCGKDDFILYNNWFGVCGKQVEAMAECYPNLIVDNSQAYYSRSKGLACFYSPRKFFGLADGGIAVCAKTTEEEFEIDESFNRCAHLLKRLDLGATAGYADFQRNDACLNDLPIRKMSALTHAVMGNIDYAEAKAKRLENFRYLEEKLGQRFNLAADDVPMVYPYMTNDASLRQRLIENKIFVATYWNSAQPDLTHKIIPLPIDQRYGLTEMGKIERLVNDY